VKSISLSRGEVALVDDDDFDILSKHKWTYSGNGYAYRMEYSNNCKTRRHILMHREIMDTPSGMDTDHINKNTLDNRRCNLRVCTTQQNTTCKVKQKNNTSGYRGVYWDKQHGCWRAAIQYYRKNHFLGLFKDKIDCAKAYDKAAGLYFKEFAVKNI